MSRRDYILVERNNQNLINPVGIKPIMSNTYTQIHIQFVFAVKFRDKTISKKWKDDLYKYITGIVQNQSHKLLAINGMSDHVHMLVGLRPSQSISELMQYVKKDFCVGLMTTN